MSQLKIFGIAKSRTFRTLWAAKELELDYEHVPIDVSNSADKSAAFLAINPNGRIPAIQDGELVLCESMAINLYLANKHKGLMPDSLEDQARVTQWSFWAVTELEPGLLTILHNRAQNPDDKQGLIEADEVEKQLAPALAVLDKALEKTGYLVTDVFTVADLNVASVMSWAKATKVDLSAVPNVADWLSRCLGRPASREARK